MKPSGWGRAVTKLIGALFMLGLAIAAADFFLMLVGLITPAQAVAGWPFGQELLSLFVEQSWTRRLVLMFAALTIGVFSIVIIEQMFRPGKPDKRLHLLEADEKGIVAVDSRGISTVAECAVMSVRGVLDTEVRVSGAPLAPVRLKVELALLPGTNVKQTGVAVKERVRETVEDVVGISVKDVTVRAHIVVPDRLSGALR